VTHLPSVLLALEEHEKTRRVCERAFSSFNSLNQYEDPFTIWGAIPPEHQDQDMLSKGVARDPDLAIGLGAAYEWSERDLIASVLKTPGNALLLREHQVTPTLLAAMLGREDRAEAQMVFFYVASTHPGKITEDMWLAHVAEFEIGLEPIESCSARVIEAAIRRGTLALDRVPLPAADAQGRARTYPPGYAATSALMDEDSYRRICRIDLARDGLRLYHVPPELQDLQSCRIAYAQNPDALQHVADARDEWRELVVTAPAGAAPSSPSSSSSS
jgi:hypothetical protein